MINNIFIIQINYKILKIYKHTKIYLSIVIIQIRVAWSLMISNRSWCFLEFASLKLYVLPTIIPYFSEIHIFTPNIVYHFTNRHITPYRSIMVNISVVSFISSDDKNHVPQRRIFRQPPVINRDGRSWWVFELSGIDVIEKLGIRIHSFFF